jgi:hypothetical protein
MARGENNRGLSLSLRNMESFLKRVRGKLFNLKKFPPEALQIKPPALPA